MSKRIDAKNLKLGDVMTVKVYLAWLESERAINTTKQAIQYQLENTDNLDWCDWQGTKYIIHNQKAKVFTPKEGKRG